VAPQPDRELAEARAAIDRGDTRAALTRLERARRGYLKQHDADGLEHLLLLADVLDPTDERTRIGRQNFVYAVKQNLRLESRRAAQRVSQPWSDPYPDLAAPAEHTGIAFTRGVKLAIAIGAGLGTAALLAVFILPFIFSSSTTAAVTLRIRNDTSAKVTVRGCDNFDCASTWMHAGLGPGLSTERNVPADDLVDLFRFERDGQDLCLPLRVHDAFVRYGSDTGVVLVGRLSRATPCPGTTILPDGSRESGL
jgi:hypothetical protein